MHKQTRLVWHRKSLHSWTDKGRRLEDRALFALHCLSSGDYALAFLSWYPVFLSATVWYAVPPCQIGW